jgi:hypothetical protein
VPYATENALASEAEGTGPVVPRGQRLFCYPENRTAGMRSAQAISSLVVKGSGGGGLGDRLWSVLVGILYSRLSGRAIFIDWSDGLYAEQGVNAFTSLFSIQGVKVLQTLPVENVSVHPPAWQGRLRRSLHEVYMEDGNPLWNRIAAIRRYSFDLAELHCPERVLVMWDFDQMDKLRPFLKPAEAVCSQEELLRTVFQTHVIPDPALSLEAERWVPDGKGRAVGVHVRAAHESSLQKGAVRLCDYFQAVDALSAATDIARIVLATDNQEVEEKFRRRYQNIITRTKWFGRPGEPLHLNPACPDRLQNTRDALVEILMLARCDYLITQGSSAFSMAARLASRAPAETMIVLHSGMPFWRRAVKYCRKVFQGSK